METFTFPQPELTHEAARTDEHVLLEGPHSRRRELWLVLRTVRDFIAGFRVLQTTMRRFLVGPGSSDPGRDAAHPFPSRV